MPLENFARAELEKGDQIIRQADHAMAEGIRVVAALQDGVHRPESYASAFPTCSTFRFRRHHRAAPVRDVPRASHAHLPGAPSANPDYALWYGWSELQRDLTEIKSMADELRDRKRRP
ncbi:MAG: hypothetical protein U1E76_07235 [Planctomycetota bacterium]